MSDRWSNHMSGGGSPVLPIAPAGRRTGPTARRVPAVGVLVLLAAVLWPSAAHAEPGEHSGCGYAFADFTALPAATDYDHRTVTLTGVLLRRHHGDGQDEPAPGEPVDLLGSVAGTAPTDDPAPGGGQDTGTPLGTVVTDAQGRFRLDGVRVDRLPDPAAGPGPYTVQVRAVHRAGGGTAGDDPAQDGGEVDARLDITATPSTARLTVDYTLGAVTSAGRAVTAQGALDRDTPLGPRPVPGATVRVSYRVPGTPALVSTATTGSDGHFSVTFAATADGTASAAVAGPPDPYLDVGGPAGTGRPIELAAPSTSPVPRPAPAPHRSAAVPVHLATATRTPTRLRAFPTPAPAAPAKPVHPADVPNSLAATGDNTPRLAFLTGGSTLLTAGLLLMVVRRRLKAAR
jgi:hypothetical protein